MNKKIAIGQTGRLKRLTVAMKQTKNIGRFNNVTSKN